MNCIDRPGPELAPQGDQCRLQSAERMTLSSARPEDFRAVISKVAGGEHLTGAEAEFAFDVCMEGSASPVQVSALLTALRVRGVVPVEVAGGVRALRKAMVTVAASRTDELVDTCGTGGGAVTTFNISTAAALVARGAGVRIAKHGNRSFTSRCGSADVLEALGVRIELAPEEMARVLEDVGLVFMFAPLLHPAMRHVGPVRRELGFPTVMNVLGPLTNPARVKRQLVGVADPKLVPLIIEALRELGHTRALVVHGEPGMDELSPMGPTRVAELADGSVSERTVTPADFGMESCPVEDLAGGEPAENAEIILRVLRGDERGGARTATLLNAAAAIYVADRSATLEEGVDVATEALDSGKALDALDRLREATRE